MSADPLAKLRLLASIVESSDDAIISKDIHGVITSWNKGAERIFGYSAEEVVGKPISVIAAPDHVGELPGILERIKNGDRIDHYATVRKTKSGKNEKKNISPRSASFYLSSAQVTTFHRDSAIQLIL